MPPPRLTAASADRMAAVVDAADALVDGGTPPDHAIAKAAAAHGLPVGHVPVVVRAFNTGRAVRQLGAADVWEKAAAYPVASADAVVALLAAPPAREKAALDLTDYVRPPGDDPFRPAYAPLVPPPATAKAAAAPPPPAAKAARDTRVAAGYAAAAAYDRAAELAAGLDPAAYAGVKVAAARVVPAAAAFFFPRAEADHLALYKLAAAGAAPDPAVRTDHPVVRALADLAAAKAAYVEGGTPGWAVPPPAAPTCPVLGTPLPPAAPAEKPAAAPRSPVDFDVPKAAAAAAASGDAEPPPPDRSFADRLLSHATGRQDPKTWFGKGFKMVAADLPAVATQNTFLGKALDLDAGGPGSRPAALGRLPSDLDRLDQQTAVQTLLADPRFAQVDPKVLVSTYRDLHALTPMAMGNPSVAGDFLQRRLQTGPLSHFEIKALTDIEQNLARIKSYRDRRDPDEDDV